MIVWLVRFLHIVFLALHRVHLNVVLNVLVDVRSLSYTQGPKDLEPGVRQSLSEYYQHHTNGEYERNDPCVAYSAQEDQKCLRNCLSIAVLCDTKVLEKSSFWCEYLFNA